MKCKQCQQEVTVDCGYETPKHGFCYQCASMKLDEIFSDLSKVSSPELPASERHLMPTSHYDKSSDPERAGHWVQGPPLGCVRPEIALAYAGELVKLCTRLRLSR